MALQSPRWAASNSRRNITAPVARRSGRSAVLPGREFQEAEIPPARFRVVSVMMDADIRAPHDLLRDTGSG